jgi:hypothetical protein
MSERYTHMICYVIVCVHTAATIALNSGSDLTGLLLTCVITSCIAILLAATDHTATPPPGNDDDANRNFIPNFVGSYLGAVTQ